MYRLGKFHKGDFNSPPCTSVSLVLGLPLHVIGRLVDDHLKAFSMFQELFEELRQCASQAARV